MDGSKDIVIDRVPVSFMKFNREVLLVTKAKDLYLRNQYYYSPISSERLFVVHNNRIKYKKIEEN